MDDLRNDDDDKYFLPGTANEQPLRTSNENRNGQINEIFVIIII